MISRQGSGLSGRHGAMSPAHTPGFNSTNDVHGLNSQGSIGSVGSRIDGTGPIRRIIRDIKTEVKVAIFDMAHKPKPIDFPHRVTARVENNFVPAPFKYFLFQNFQAFSSSIIRRNR